MEFQVEDKVMLKISPWKGVVPFGKRGKLNPRYVRPFKVLEIVRDVAYKLDLPEELIRVHNTFHVSNMKKCYADEPLAVLLDGLHVDDKLHFVEEPVEIMDREVKRLKRIMSSDSHATITYTSMSSYEDIVNGYYGMPMDPLDPYPLPTVVSPTAESPRYITKSEPEMEPEEEDGDDEKSEEDSIEYPTSGGDDDADDDGANLSEDDADNEDEDESLDSEEEDDEHLALIVPAPALYSSVSASEETKPFEEGKTAATPPPFGYFSPTSYPLPQCLMPLPIFTPLPTSSFPLPSSLPSTSGSKSIPEADIPLRKRACFTTPTGGYEVGESYVATAARHIRFALTIADRSRADDRLIGRLRRDRSWTTASHERFIPVH
uniref:Putative reverse transcriptase domain-containing protein n=1 Tax=Tanacetum cinerariifolium TaxID=118510 RepID=A0A6L2JCR7_TANCI|nr:putative reverse transcriptase domain-containing protein [Tanacetum cinerariifolium]